MRISSTLSLLVGLFLAGSLFAADKPMVVELWPGKVPDAYGHSCRDLGRPTLAGPDSLSRLLCPISSIAVIDSALLPERAVTA